MGHCISRIASFVTLAAVLSLPAAAATTTWQIDPAHTSANFSVRHLMISTVRGEFKGVTGTIVWDDQDITKSTVNVTIDTTTVTTGEPKRDNDLRTNTDFFDTAKYPTITFKSSKVEQVAPGKLKVTGALTIRDVTKNDVVLDVDGPSAAVKDPWGNTRRAVSATTRINRREYGVVWDKKMDNGGVVVSDDVNISIDLEMTKEK